MATRWLITFLLALLAARPAARAAEPGGNPVETLRRAHEGLRRTVLNNGMALLVKEDHSAPVVAIQVWVGSGSIHEQEWLGAGLSHFVEHMIFKGTPTRSPGEISRQISDAGGDINAYTGFDRTVFHVTLPARNWTVGLDVLADAVMNASFPEEEWAREREVILREFAMHRDNPDREVGQMLWANAFRAHPYRIPVIGYEDVFTATTRDDLAAYFRRNYTPDNMIVSIVGDVPADEVEQRVKETFAGFARRARAPLLLPAEPVQISPRFERRTGPYEVTRVRMAWPTVPMNHPDAAALDVLAALMGQGRSSRLTSELVEKRKLAFDLSAWSYTPLDIGLFGIGGTCDPARETDLLNAVEEDVAGWAAMTVPPEDLAKARRQVLVGELSSLEDMAGQAASFASGEFYAADPRFSERYLQGVERVDAASLRDVARRYLSPEKRTLVILAPAGTGATVQAVEPPRPGSDVVKIELPGGIPLIVREDHRLPFVNVAIVLRGGLLSEDADRNGITPLMAELLTRGTASRSSEEIAQQVEQLGGSLSAFSGWNSFGLQARGLSQDAAVFLDLAAECLLQPSFDPAEIDKQRDLQKAAIRRQREQPMYRAQVALQEALFPGHPYRLPELGTEESVDRIRREDLVAHLQKLAVSGNLALSVFGDIDPEEARRLVEKAFAGVPRGQAPEPPRVASAPTLPSRSESREPREQAILLVGYPGVDVRDPRCDALAVVRDTLSGLSSDLGVEVRDRRGLAYFVGAFSREGLQPGLFALYAGAKEDTVQQVEELMAAQVERLGREGPRPEELQRAVEQLVAGHQMSLQDNDGLAQLCALHELYGLGYRYAFTAEERWRALTVEQVRDAAASLLKPDRQAVSIVLPETSKTHGEKK
ncbi:MAG TPA: pitrilysin family protein [Kiritimatiellia bacterium]|nr:pitrilysin family protein [Kiritimatiellia bacterium]HRZ13322.1 pitrilysin family protein [Kiritimatiellia bacterium]HSA18771.1 pitrilysin family protein [Kiritimatiellia bacterium]